MVLVLEDMVFGGPVFAMLLRESDYRDSDSGLTGQHTWNFRILLTRFGRATAVNMESTEFAEKVSLH